MWHIAPGLERSEIEEDNNRIRIMELKEKETTLRKQDSEKKSELEVELKSKRSVASTKAAQTRKQNQLSKLQDELKTIQIKKARNSKGDIIKPSHRIPSPTPPIRRADTEHIPSSPLPPSLPRPLAVVGSKRITTSPTSEEIEKLKKSKLDEVLKRIEGEILKDPQVERTRLEVLEVTKQKMLGEKRLIEAETHANELKTIRKNTESEKYSIMEKIEKEYNKSREDFLFKLKTEQADRDYKYLQQKQDDYKDTFEHTFNFRIFF
jgi:hypothetical protein